MNAPDYCEALTAYRAFNVVGGLLCGQAYNEPWPPYQPMIAHCASVSSAAGHLVNDGAGRTAWRGAPGWHCGCGLHAVKSPDVAAARAAGAVGVLYSGMGGEGTAWGTVKLWGRVIEHAEGYRAEFGYPADLSCTDARLAARIATLYGIPCRHAAAPVDDPCLPYTVSFNVNGSSTPQWFVGQQQLYVIPPQHTTPIMTGTAAEARKALAKLRQVDQRKFLAQRSGTWTNP